MSTEPLKFSEVTSVKLPRSAAYIYNNLIEFNDKINNISYYAIINGYEVWIIKHSNAEKLTGFNKKEPTVQLRKVPYDKLDYVSCVKWCKFGSTLTFIMATQNGYIYVYDFDAKKLLYFHDITSIQTEIKNKINKNSSYNPTINCIECNDKNLLFIGLSSGALLSFNIDEHGLSNKKLIYQCENNEGINCISKTNKTTINNKIYFGCDDGKVIQYDFYSNDIDILIDKSNINKVYIGKTGEEEKNDILYNEQFPDTKYINNCGSCICIACCDEFVVAGYQSGHIKIVQKSELSFMIKQIAMHRRMITSIAILQDMSLIATVSEDGYYHIIRNTSSSLDLIRSGSFDNTLLIGVKFVKSQHYSLYDQKYKDRIILITGYDRHRVVFV